MSDPIITKEVVTQLVVGAGSIGAFGIVLGRELLNWLRKRNEEKAEDHGGNGKSTIVAVPPVCISHSDLVASIKDLCAKVDDVKDTVVDEGRKSGERLARLEAKQEGTQAQVAEIFTRINRRDP